MLNKTDLSRVDLNLLVLFEVMAEELHVTRSAARLNISPSAVSHGLARLRVSLNDPLFIKQPRGMLATDRALELAPAITAILDGVRGVVASSVPFDPATSHRQFRIGMAEGFFSVIGALVGELGRSAPNIDLSLRHMQRESALEQLDERYFDLAIAPFFEVPARFRALPLYDERFVIAMREGHPFAADPSLDNYCRQRHLLVAPRGDLRGMVDDMLAQLGRHRRVALAVPTFLLALELVEAGDMVTLLPERFVRANAHRYRVAAAEIPFAVDKVTIQAVAPESAMRDAGMRWLFGQLQALAALPRQNRGQGPSAPPGRAH